MLCKGAVLAVLFATLMNWMFKPSYVVCHESIWKGQNTEEEERNAAGDLVVAPCKYVEKQSCSPPYDSWQEAFEVENYWNHVNNGVIYWVEKYRWSQPMDRRFQLFKNEL